MNDAADVIGSNLDLWAALIGFFLPLVIAAIERTAWGSAARAWVAFLACVVVAAGTAWFSGHFDTPDVTRTVLIVATLAMTTYSGIWKPTGIAPAIEGRTNPHA